MAKVEPAVKVALSPATTAIVYGVGKVMIDRGGRSFHLNEREAKNLVDEWTAFQADRLGSRAATTS